MFQWKGESLYLICIVTIESGELEMGELVHGMLYESSCCCTKINWSDPLFCVCILPVPVRFCN